jgi:hypothetical protein
MILLPESAKELGTDPPKNKSKDKDGSCMKASGGGFELFLGT